MEKSRILKVATQFELFIVNNAYIRQLNTEGTGSLTFYKTNNFLKKLTTKEKNFYKGYSVSCLLL